MSRNTAIWIATALLITTAGSLAIPDGKHASDYPFVMRFAPKLIAIGLAPFLCLCLSISLYREPRDLRRYATPSLILLLIVANAAWLDHLRHRFPVHCTCVSGTGASSFTRP